MIEIPGLPRSAREMQFAASLVPCPACGLRDQPPLQLSGNRPWQFLTGACPRCRTKRDFRFVVGQTRPLDVSPPGLHLGGPEPSEIIRPFQLVDELDRIAPSLVWEPESLGVAAWRAQGPILGRAITCLLELGKFVPAGSDRIPDSVLDDEGRRDRAARPERYRRDWLTTETARYTALFDRRKHDGETRIAALAAADAPPPPRGKLDRATADAHRAWVRAGQSGPGRLDIAYVDARKAKLGAQELSGSRFDSVDLAEADASYSTFAHAEWTDVRAPGANLGSCSFAGARLVRCDVEGAYLALAKLGGAVVGGGNWSRTNLDRALLDGARFDGTELRDADFGNARLDDAIFVDCDMRGASFALRTAQPLGTTMNARFERCDLRNTQWTGRNLAGAIFVDCRFYGAGGRPGAADPITIERPDMSRAGDGTKIATPDDVMDLWRGAT
jgi:uncharacterized protein YjbI with pentapeptide repeats